MIFSWCMHFLKWCKNKHFMYEVLILSPSHLYSLNILKKKKDVWLTLSLPWSSWEWHIWKRHNFLDVLWWKSLWIKRLWIFPYMGISMQCHNAYTYYWTWMEAERDSYQTRQFWIHKKGQARLIIWVVTNNIVSDQNFKDWWHSTHVCYNQFWWKFRLWLPEWERNLIFITKNCDTFIIVHPQSFANSLWHLLLCLILEVISRRRIYGYTCVFISWYIFSWR